MSNQWLSCLDHSIASVNTQSGVVHVGKVDRTDSVNPQSGIVHCM